VPIKILVAEPECFSRDRILKALQMRPRFILVGPEHADGVGLEILERFDPDAIFVDVKSNCFDTIRSQLNRLHKIPKIVAMAWERAGAAEGYEIGAMDFLHKPFSDRAVERVLERIAAEIDADKTTLRSFRQTTNRLIFKSEGKIVFVDMDQIDWIKSNGNYISIHVGPHSHCIRSTMGQIEDRLRRSLFIRVHRTAIVNVRSIAEVQPSAEDGQSVVLLRDGTRLNLGPTYRTKLLRMADGGLDDLLEDPSQGSAGEL
jgi:two-component system, LytTR family, response regulator